MLGVTVDRQGRINLSLGVLASAVVAVGTAYPVTRAAMGQAMKAQIREETRPLVNAFEVTLQQNVNTLRKTIAALEFKRDMCATMPECWTVRDAQDLLFTRDDLRAAEAALAGIKESKQ